MGVDDKFWYGRIEKVLGLVTSMVNPPDPSKEHPTEQDRIDLRLGVVIPATLICDTIKKIPDSE